MTTSSRAVLFRGISETDWQRQVIEWARRGGWLVYHVHDSRKQEWDTDAGFPDLVLVRPPRIMFVELKRERGALTKGQQVWLAALEDSPFAECHMWRPSDEQEVKKALGSIND